MFRDATAHVVALCLAPTVLRAQSTTFTVSVASASIYKSPSTGSPVIGTASRGTVLEVTRELGSWVKVVWAGAQDGVGCIHVSMGSIPHRTASGANRTAEKLPARPASGSTSITVQAPGSPQRRQAAPPPHGGQPVSSTRDQYITLPTHLIGLAA